MSEALQSASTLDAIEPDRGPDRAFRDDPAAPATSAPGSQNALWGAVVSMMLGVFGLVTAEFLPASLLTPMARDLGVTEGVAGQAVTATATVALITSLLVATVTRRLDRRIVLLAFSILLIASNLLVAYAPSLAAVLAGRVLLGIAIGGFWTMSAATAMRLVPDALVPRALSIMFSGVSLATSGPGWAALPASDLQALRAMACKLQAFDGAPNIRNAPFMCAPLDGTFPVEQPAPNGAPATAPPSTPAATSPASSAAPASGGSAR